MLRMESGVLFGSVASSCSLLHMMLKVGSSGTNVKRAFALYDDMVSPCCIWMELASFIVLGVSDMVGKHLLEVGGCLPFL